MSKEGLDSKLQGLAEYAFSKSKLSEVVESFKKNVKPYYKNNLGAGMYAVEEEPVPELGRFWQDVESITGCKFSDFEKRVLTTDPAKPVGFLGGLMDAAEKWKSLSAIHGELVYNKEIENLERMVKAFD